MATIPNNESIRIGGRRPGDQDGLGGVVAPDIVYIGALQGKLGGDKGGNSDGNNIGIDGSTSTC